MAASKAGFMKDAFILFAITLVSGICLGFVYEINPQIGVFVAVDDRYFGMIPRTEVFAEYHYGQQVECRVLRVPMTATAGW